MIRSLFILAQLLLLGIAAVGQTITFTIKESPIPMAFIYVNHGNNTEKVDSAAIQANGKYVFRVNPKTIAGEYTLSLPGKGETRFLYCGESINASASFKTFSELVEFTNSQENEVYQEFITAQRLYEKRRELLEKLKVLYPDSSSQQKQFVTAITNAEQDFWEASQTIAERNPTLLATTIIKATIGKKPATTLTPKEAKAWKKAHFWDGINLTDPRLEFTEIGGSIIWNYLELYFEKGVSKENQEVEFKKAINASFGRSDIAENLVFFWANELFKVFSETEYEGMTTFLWDTFIETGCSQVESRPLNATDIQNIRNTAVGQKAFNFTILSNGKKIKLSKLESRYKLVLFWSSWCPHCIMELPHIKELYETYHSQGFDIIGISLDYGKDDYQNFLKRENLKWINYLDPEPFQSEISQKYNVSGTPKMVLVDENLTILSKPATAEQLESTLKTLFQKR